MYKTHKREVVWVPLTSINTRARQPHPDAKAILSKNGEQQPSTELTALSKAMWIYARPSLQGGTQSQHRCPSQGMGGEVPQVFFRIRWIRACLAFTHTQIFCQGWNACGDVALHSKKDWQFFWQFSKSPWHFIVLNLMVKPSTGRPKGKAPPLHWENFSGVERLQRWQTQLQQKKEDSVNGKWFFRLKKQQSFF